MAEKRMGNETFRHREIGIRNVRALCAERVLGVFHRSV